MANADSLAVRARRIRARALARSWKYRQRRHAAGVWFRLRRLLAEARACWLVPEDQCESLVAEGFRPEPVGLELEPPKSILCLPASRIERIPGREPLRVAVTAELLAARCLVLELFERGWAGVVAGHESPRRSAGGESEGGGTNREE